MIEFPEVSIEKICHEVNKAFCEYLGDDSQLSWEEVPEWQKESAIKGVEFHFNNPDSKPSDSHKSWLKEKLKNGWKYGTVKNVELKIHPCIVPFEELSKDQQFKYVLFLTIVKSCIS